MAEQKLATMAVFTVRDMRTVSGGTVFLDGFWAAAGESVKGALMWSCSRIRPPDVGCILGISRKAECLKDRQTQTPEPFRRRITDPDQVILIHKPGKPPYEDEDQGQPDSGGEDYPF